MEDFRGMAAGLDPAQLVDFSLQELLDLSDESPPRGASAGAHPAPSRAYGRDAKAMAATPADVKEAPGTYAFVVDMPGLKAEQIKVRVEEGKVLVVSGERRRERADAEQGVKYLRIERRLGKYLKKFVLPENADADKIAAEYQDGVLTVTVEKQPPPEPKKLKTIEVHVA